MKCMKMNAIKMKREMGLQPLYFGLVYLVTFMSLVIIFDEVWEEEVAQRCACSKSFVNSRDKVKDRNYCSLRGKNNYNSANLKCIGRRWGDWELRAVSSVRVGGGMELVRNTGYSLIGELASLILLI